MISGWSQSNRPTFVYLLSEQGTTEPEDRAHYQSAHHTKTGFVLFTGQGLQDELGQALAGPMVVGRTLCRWISVQRFNFRFNGCLSSIKSAKYIVAHPSMILNSTMGHACKRQCMVNGLIRKLCITVLRRCWRCTEPSNGASSVSIPSRSQIVHAGFCARHRGVFQTVRTEPRWMAGTARFKTELRSNGAPAPVTMTALPVMLASSMSSPALPGLYPTDRRWRLH